MLWSAPPTSLSLPIERATKEKSKIERRNRKQSEERGAYSPEQEACSITSLSPGDKSPSALSRIRHMQHRLKPNLLFFIFLCLLCVEQFAHLEVLPLCRKRCRLTTQSEISSQKGGAKMKLTGGEAGGKKEQKRGANERLACSSC